MRSILILAAALLPALAFAEVGDVNCTAKQFEITSSGLVNQVEKPLIFSLKEGGVLRAEVEIGDRAYVLAGDTNSGDFLLTQALGPDYTTGINATGSFTSTGRMQISSVDGNKVFKLECRKVLASEFPAE